MLAKWKTLAKSNQLGYKNTLNLIFYIATSYFILDNTEWPEALDDPEWTKPETIPSDGSKDVYIQLETKS